jgi:hypothetical protein
MCARGINFASFYDFLLVLVLLLQCGILFYLHFFCMSSIASDKLFPCITGSEIRSVH